MVLKKKSISIHTVVTIVLAVLLTLSLALGLTGAWFTDTANGTGNVNFGKVSVGESVTVNVPANIVPTQQIKFVDIQYDGVPAYYRVTVGLDESDYGTKKGEYPEWPSAEAVKGVLNQATVYGQIGDYYTSQDNSILSQQVSITPISIPSSVGNEFQEISCILKVKIDVIQQLGTREAAKINTSGSVTSEQLATIFNTVMPA